MLFTFSKQTSSIQSLKGSITQQANFQRAALKLLPFASTEIIDSKTEILWAGLKNKSTHKPLLTFWLTDIFLTFFSLLWWESRKWNHTMHFVLHLSFFFYSICKDNVSMSCIHSVNPYSIFPECLLARHFLGTRDTAEYKIKSLFSLNLHCSGGR